MKKIIKTEEQYEEAMARHLELMHADPPPGSAAFDELELLTLLIQSYENQTVHFPDPSAVEAIKFRMEQQDLKQKDLINLIGTKSQVSQILSGKRPLTLAMARRLHEELGIPAEVLLRESVPEASEDLDISHYPVKEMHSYGWFPQFAHLDWRRAKTHAEEMLQSLYASFQSGKIHAFNRAGFKPDQVLDEYALSAWRCKTLLDSEKLKLPDYSNDALTPEFADFIAKLTPLDDGPHMVIEQLQSRGVAVVINKHLPKTYLDGAAMVNRNGNPVIGLTLRHDRLDNFWHTLFHELGHVMKHLDKNSGEEFFDDAESGDNREKEKEANDFALNTLISPRKWSELKTLSKASEVRSAAKRLAIHPAIIAGRIRRETQSYSKLRTLIGQGEVRSKLLERDVSAS